MDPDDFRSILGRFASGVTVVTATGEDGDCGITVSAFASLSLDPPLVVVCIDHAARMHSVLRAASHFVVNVLEESQETLARRFSDPDRKQFDDIGFERGEMGAPVLGNALAAIECAKREEFAGGDHTIFVGEVETATVGSGGPLIYYRGGYAQLVR